MAWGHDTAPVVVGALRSGESDVNTGPAVDREPLGGKLVGDPLIRVQGARQAAVQQRPARHALPAVRLQLRADRTAGVFLAVDVHVVAVRVLLDRFDQRCGC